jgi:hypothetical protein
MSFSILIVVSFALYSFERGQSGSEYRVVSRTNPTQFEQQVSYQLSLGFKCEGGIAVSVNGSTVTYLQAMVR